MTATEILWNQRSVDADDPPPRLVADAADYHEAQAELDRLIAEQERHRNSPKAAPIPRPRRTKWCCGRPVVVLDLRLAFPSRSAAAEWLGLNPSTVTEAMRHGCVTHGHQLAEYDPTLHAGFRIIGAEDMERKKVKS